MWFTPEHRKSPAVVFYADSRIMGNTMSRRDIESVVVCGQDVDRLSLLGSRYLQEGFDTSEELPDDSDVRFQQAAACLGLGVAISRLNVARATNELTPIDRLDVAVRQQRLLQEARIFALTGRAVMMEADDWRYPARLKQH